MPSAPQIRKRNEIYEKNIHKRGNVPTTLKKKQDDDEDARSPYAIYIVGFLIVLLVGGVVVEATMRLF
ncbi:hypothetical protein HK105_207856 [Polyrhizophydium stewartii]|uniref:Stress-associated endoplasmic reticulum protein n=1 Tax=Polyrhizophydium stewartii TaxID=2732419 RepID=A0ABR4MZG1_9FUNG